MKRYILVSLFSGLIFALLDALINANPLAQQLYAAYQVLARPVVNATTGIGFDLIYGFGMAGIFMVLYPSLPGSSGLRKGMSYGLLAWFFRVLMPAASGWVMFQIPVATYFYTLGTGLLEMTVLGLLYGICLKPVDS